MYFIHNLCMFHPVVIHCGSPMLVVHVCGVGHSCHHFLCLDYRPGPFLAPPRLSQSTLEESHLWGWICPVQFLLLGWVWFLVVWRTQCQGYLLGFHPWLGPVLLMPHLYMGQILPSLVRKSLPKLENHSNRLDPLSMWATSLLNNEKAASSLAISLSQETLHQVVFLKAHGLICHINRLWPCLKNLHNWTSHVWKPLLHEVAYIYPCAWRFFIIEFDSVEDR